MYRIGVMLLLLLPPAVAAAGDNKDAAPDKPKSASVKALSPAEQLAAIEKEYRQKERDLFAAYNKAKTREEKRKVLADRPDTAAYARKALAVARKYPNDPVAVKALVFAVQNGRGSPAQAEAVGILVHNHLDSAELSKVVELLASSESPEAEKDLRTIIEKSPHHDVRGLATYALARYYGNQASDNDVTEEQRQRYNEKRLPLLKEIVGTYSDVQRYGRPLAKAASGDLYEIEHLSVGMLAPDIEGDDLEGKPFKLADYRGKVVLLDFWGNW